MSRSRIKASVGYQLSAVTNIVSDLEESEKNLYSFLVCPLFRDHLSPPIPDVIMRSSDWSRRIIGRVDTSIITDDNLEGMKKIQHQAGYMAYAGVYGIYFDCPSSRSGVIRLAQVINQIQYHKVFVRIKIDLKVRGRGGGLTNGHVNGQQDEENPDPVYTDAWEQWNHLRSHLTPGLKVEIALEVGGDLPDMDIQDRWGGEPIRFIVLPTSCFTTNESGYPVLSIGYQKFVSLLMYVTADSLCFLIRGAPQVRTLKEYAMYADHMVKGLSEKNEVEILRGTEDYVQIPLQPLQDNLEGATYEIFEKDPVKYEVYRKAIQDAIMDKKKQKDDIVVMVVGAGRGPLVTATMYAAEDAKAKITLYVVEKNVYAMPTLHQINDTMWQNSSFINVHIFNTDMRDFVAPKKADIVVSELLGSFADNELSPECLDGVSSSVHEDSISIPQEYTSFLRPMTSQKLWNEVHGIPSEKPGSSLEGNYVVNMRNVYFPCKEAQELFKFDHQNLSLPPTARNNCRSKSLTFESKLDYMCHGFAGYFETILYKNHRLSIKEDSYSIGMFSWFPIFFPIVNPFLVKSGQKLTINFNRMVSSSKVWYEFCISSPIALPTQNQNGKSSNIGLH